MSVSTTLCKAFFNADFLRQTTSGKHVFHACTMHLDNSHYYHHSIFLVFICV
jgi:hypothetical protein